MVATTESLWNPWTPPLASRRIFSTVSRSMNGIYPTMLRQIMAKASRTLILNGTIQTAWFQNLLARHQITQFYGDLVFRILPHTRKDPPSFKPLSTSFCPRGSTCTNSHYLLSCLLLFEYTLFQLGFYSVSLYTQSGTFPDVRHCMFYIHPRVLAFT
jgi:hypothetical protein